MSACAATASRRSRIEARLRFTAWSDPLAFKSGLTGAVAARHYEQPGSVAGTITVGGRRHGLAGAGLRDHSWGVRDWQAVPYWRWFGMVVDPDTFVVVNNVGTADGGETAGGYLMRDGSPGSDRRVPHRSRSSTRSWAASAHSRRTRPTATGGGPCSPARRSRSLRCASAATAA